MNLCSPELQENYQDACHSISRLRKIKLIRYLQLCPMPGIQISEISVNFHPVPANVFNQAKNISARGAYELSSQSLRQIGHTNKPRLTT